MPSPVRIVTLLEDAAPGAGRGITKRLQPVNPGYDRQLNIKRGGGHDLTFRSPGARAAAAEGQGDGRLPTSRKSWQLVAGRRPFTKGPRVRRPDKSRGRGSVPAPERQRGRPWRSTSRVNVWSSLRQYPNVTMASARNLSPAVEPSAGGVSSNPVGALLPCPASSPTAAARTHSTGGLDRGNGLAVVRYRRSTACADTISTRRRMPDSS
jgi:hypothetical protein